jgi:hypothetical protein
VRLSRLKSSVSLSTSTSLSLSFPCVSTASLVLDMFSHALSVRVHALFRLVAGSRHAFLPCRVEYPGPNSGSFTHIFTFSFPHATAHKADSCTKALRNLYHGNTGSDSHNGESCDTASLPCRAERSQCSLILQRCPLAWPSMASLTARLGESAASHHNFISRTIHKSRVRQGLSQPAICYSTRSNRRDLFRLPRCSSHR